VEKHDLHLYVLIGLYPHLKKKKKKKKKKRKKKKGEKECGLFSVFFLVVVL